MLIEVFLWARHDASKSFSFTNSYNSLRWILLSLFTDRETEAQGGLPKVTQPVRVSTILSPGNPAPRLMPLPWSDNASQNTFSP